MTISSSDKPIINISIVGVGKAGINVVNSLKNNNDNLLADIKITYASSNRKTLENYQENSIIFLENKNNNDFGSIGDPVLASAIANDSIDKIKEAINGTNLLILTAGFGGGTGTGALPVIAKIARQMGIITVAIITTPFSYEGTAKNLNARAGIEKLKENIDIVTIISNNKIMNNYPDIAVLDAYKLVNNVLKNCIKTFISLNKKNSMVNLNPADVLSTIKDRGEAYIGFGNGVGRNKVYRAINGAINSKIIETSIKSATDAILNITSDPSVTMQEIEEIIRDFKVKSKNENLNIHFSFDIDQNLRNEVRISVIATRQKSIGNMKEIETNKLLNDSQEVLIEIGNTLENELNGYTTGELYLPTFDIEKMNNQIDDKDQESTFISNEVSADEDDDIPFFLK